MTTTCPQCGTALDHDRRDCPVCGADVPATPEDAVTAEDAPDAPVWTATVGEGEDAATDDAVDDEPAPDAPGDGAVPPPPSSPWNAPPPPTRAAVHAAPVPHPSGLPNELRTWGMLTHLSAFGGLVVGFSFVGPLVMWLVKREEHPFVDHHGREALNFNLSLLLYGAIGLVLAVATLGIGLVVLLPAAFAIGVLWFVVTIIAAVKANNGEGYRYPLSIRFIKE